MEIKEEKSEPHYEPIPDENDLRMSILHENRELERKNTDLKINLTLVSSLAIALAIYIIYKN